MSIADHPSHPALRRRWLAWSAGEASLGVATRVCRRAWQALRSDRPLVMGIVWGLAAWIVLELLFVGWVHRNAEGVSYRAFLPGVMLGQTEAERASGWQPVCKVGFDGQQYYRISNDLLARKNPANAMTNVIYRYQRIGMPLIAGSVAGLLGYSVTPPLLYHSLQIGLTCVGFGALVYWLVAHRLSPAYALGWLLAGGTINALWVGVADAPGDAFFILAMLAILSRRLWAYVPLATLMVLTREGYVAFAFPIFLLTALGRCGWQSGTGEWKMLPTFTWRDVTGYWKPVLLTALPGIIVVGWTLFLEVQLQTSAREARSDPNMQGWPFVALVEYLKLTFRDGNWVQLRLLLASAFTVVGVLLLLVRNVRRAPLALLCAAPYLLLIASLGNYTWEHYICFLRVIGGPIAIGVLLLPYDKSLVLRFMLALQAMVGLDLQIEQRLFHSRQFSPYLIHEDEGFAPNPAGAPDNPLLTDLRSSVEWTDAKPVLRMDYHGVWSRVHREVRPVTIAVTNHSDVTWQPGKGQHAIYLGCRIYDESGQRQLAEHSAILTQPIAPGETKNLSAYLELWRPGRNYVVEFSLWQEGKGWFVQTDATFGRRYEYRVE
ncbi:MAG: hypothetical protein AB7O59_15470 [Pirellulales bacterium]